MNSFAKNQSSLGEYVCEVKVTAKVVEEQGYNINLVNACTIFEQSANR